MTYSDILETMSVVERLNTVGRQDRPDNPSLSFSLLRTEQEKQALAVRC